MKKGLISSAVLALLLSSILTGCAHTGTHPDDASVAEHEAAANADAKRAQQHDAMAERGGHPKSDPPATHRYKAERLRQHAELHQAAADSLRAYEAKECDDISAQTRSECPLMQVDRVENSANGVILHLKSGTDAVQATRQIQCHLAFARSQGYQGMDDCPFFLHGLSAQQQGQSAVVLTAEDSSSASQLKAKMHEIYGD